MPADTPILQAMTEKVIIADGAFGTFATHRGVVVSDLPTPALNLQAADAVLALHREYVAAGAKLLLTNTFTANAASLHQFGLKNFAVEICQRGAEIAREAIGQSGWVAGSIGPLGRIQQSMTDQEARAAFRPQVEGLLAGGVDLISLETFSSLGDLILAIQAIRDHSSDVVISAQLAFTLAGTTTRGVTARSFVAAMSDQPIQILGANCGGGEAAALHIAEELASLTDMPIAIFPNRGLASLDEQGMPLYQTGPDYFAENATRIAHAGANIVGGCCGTTPADIQALKGLLGDYVPAQRVIASTPAAAGASSKSPPPVIAFQRRVTELAPDGVCVIAEVDPPRGMNFGPQLRGAEKLLEAGVDSITIADNPLGVMRMSNLAMAALLMQKYGANITLHIACRDRNIIGNQSHLLGAAALGISNILTVTGDPVATDAFKGSSGVFDLSSQNLMKLVKQMNDGAYEGKNDQGLWPRFAIGGAFNAGARSLEAETRKTKRKVDNGATFIMTQPVYELALAEQILDLLEPLGIKVFIGVMPLLSERNAEFLHNEVPGIVVPEAVRARMKGTQGREGREIGMAICKEVIDQIAPRSKGIYLIAPLDRYSLCAELAAHAKKVAL